MTEKPTRVEIGCFALLFIGLSILGFLALGWLFLPSDPVKTAESELRTKLPAGTKAASHRDSGAGLPFPGGASDGYSWLILQVSAAEATNFGKTLANSPRWRRLPLPPELAAGAEQLQPSIMGLTGHIPLETAVGYYLLIDYQAEWNERKNPRPRYQTAKPIWQRPSPDIS